MNMAIKSHEQILSEIISHAEKGYSIPSDWYVGITHSPIQTLFQIHRVDRQNGFWIYRTAGSKEEARKIKDELLERGFVTKPELINDGTVVFAYKKTNTTIP